MLTEDRPEQSEPLMSPHASVKSKGHNPSAIRRAIQSRNRGDLPDNVSILQTRRRLMFVIEALTVGGAEQLVVDLANEFVQRGDVVHVVCLSMPGELSSRLLPDVCLHVLDKKRGIDYRIAGRLRALAKKHRVQVINSHLWTANLWSRIALMRSGIPVVITEHSRDTWKPLHYRLADRALSHVTARLIAVSQDTANFYTKNVGVDSLLVTVINNGVDTSLYASGNGSLLRNKLASPGDFLIGTVGRLTPAKNHSRLVEAAALLRDAGVPVRVVIVGEGPERSTTEARIADLNMEDQVMLLGERNDVPDLLAAFDVFVLSSDREGHPLSALEAQSAGTPVVLTDAGGSADAVLGNDQGVGGLLVEKSAEALAESLGALAAEPRRLREMSAFAQTHAARQFDKMLMIDRYSDVFNAVQHEDLVGRNS